MKFFSSPPATAPRRAIEEAHPLISPVPGNPPARPRRTRAEEEQVRIRRRALENCRKALELLENAAGEPYDEDVAKDAPLATARGVEGSPLRSDTDADELCTLLKSRVELSYFLEKLWSMQTSVHQNIHDDNASWDMVTARDLWEDRLVDEENDSEQDGFVLVRQEDIVDGIACFMADYLLSLQQMKLTFANQLQDALCKTFSVKKRSQLRKACDGSKVIYNVASWSATAIEKYQNPKAASSLAFLSSRCVVSKLILVPSQLLSAEVMCHTRYHNTELAGIKRAKYVIIIIIIAREANCLQMDA